MSGGASDPFIRPRPPLRRHFDDPDFALSVLLLHVVCTWFMVGLIWTIQIVHYPLFAWVGETTFEAFEKGHTTRMSRLLAVPASMEVVTGALLVWVAPGGLSPALVLASGSILATLWVVTLLVQVPLHRALSAQRFESAISRLVSSNWLRTTGWTIRGLLVILMLGQVI